MTNWPDEVTVTLTGMAQGGAAVGRWEGRVVFATGGLPGETVVVRLAQRQKAFASGTVQAIDQPSPHRVPPRDPAGDHADWQHIAYDEQLRFKQQIVAEQLAHLGALGEVDVQPTIPSPAPWGYRSSATFHGNTMGQLGYYVPGSQQVADRNHDALLVPVLNHGLDTLHDTLRDGQAWLSEATLRASGTDRDVLAVLSGPGDLAALTRDWQRRFPRLSSALSLDRPNAELLLGDGAFYEKIGGLRLRVSAGSFFQTNLPQTETLLALVREWLAPLTRGGRLLDAYCGVGTFALPLARDGARLVGIEDHWQAIADMKANTARHSLDAELLEGTVEAVLPGLTGPIDGAVLDPPRRGCDPVALDALVALRPKRIAYVSCHPGTLARDLKLLCAAGYRLARVQPVDMFPQTHHIEAVALLDLP